MYKKNCHFSSQFFNGTKTSKSCDEIREFARIGVFKAKGRMGLPLNNGTVWDAFVRCIANVLCILMCTTFIIYPENKHGLNRQNFQELKIWHCMKTN